MAGKKKLVSALDALSALKKSAPAKAAPKKVVVKAKVETKAGAATKSKAPAQAVKTKAKSKIEKAKTRAKAAPRPRPKKGELRAGYKDGKPVGFKFPEGNRFWECRAKHGRSGIWATPEDLMADCVTYFEWLELNPILEEQGFAFQGVVTHEIFSKMRAATIFGLCSHLGIVHETWLQYRKKPGFSVVCAHVDGAIRDQKFTGAAAGVLNASIIARDLGLHDNVNAKLTGAGGGPIETITTNMDPKVASDIYKKLMTRPDD